MTRSRFLAVVAAGALLESCHRTTRIAQAPPAPQPASLPPNSASIPGKRNHRAPAALPADLAPETGVASWYGHPYHGRASASGEIYDMEQMTAAHRTLPFGTRVHVEDLDNGMSTEVRINDRGPFVNNRVIDLSHAAALAINMVGPGVANVRLTIVQSPAVPEPAVFAIQVAAFSSRENADRLQARMNELYGAATLRLRSGNPPLWRVLVGHAADPARADELAQRIRSEQKVPEAFVVRLDPTGS